MSIITSVKGAVKVAKAGRAGLVAQKYAPQILTGVGVAGVVAAAVLSSKATLRLEEVVDKHRLDIDKVNSFAHERPADEYSSTDHKKDLAIVYTRMVVDITKLYALPVSLGLVSLGCIIGGQGLQYKRTVSSIAAYKSLEETVKKYRARVAEELGLEKEQDLYSGYSEAAEKDEDGKTVINLDPRKVGEQVFFFDRDNINWRPDPSYNLMYANCQETYAQQRLDGKGHIFLNEVLEGFGMKPVPEGQALGWIQTQDGVNKVDFGIKDCQTVNARIFGAGEDEMDCIILDFRGLTSIWDKI